MKENKGQVDKNNLMVKDNMCSEDAESLIYFDRMYVVFIFTTRVYYWLTCYT